jgi:RNA 3'-terminal phosphate cyclase (ATP)
VTDAMIRVDGSQGEGGGQILRTALALSALRGVPVRITEVRANRAKPGLQPQHLAAARAVAAVSGGRLGGDTLGSSELAFWPREVRAGDYRFDVGTAGSAPLVLQAVLLPLALAEGISRVSVTGGTHVAWSPPADYLTGVLFPALSGLGARIRLLEVRPGFYPKGGGRLTVEVTGGADLEGLTCVRQMGQMRLRAVSLVAGLPRVLAERQAVALAERLAAAGWDVTSEIRESSAESPGRFLFLLAEGEGLPAGFSTLGEREEPVEAAAERVVADFLAFARSGAACDPHLADQLIPAMAVAAGTSRLTTAAVTGHLQTTLDVTRQLLACPVQMSGQAGQPGAITIQGGTPRVERTPALAGAEPAGSGEARAYRGTRTVANPAIQVRRAHAGDGPAIQRILAQFATRGQVLPRTLNEVYRNLRDFVVGEIGGEVVGVCALSLYWEDLAEVRSLAVLETHGGSGLGSALVQACMDEAAALGIRRVFALTYRQRFFERLGFRVIEKEELPQKIWKDCIRCARFTCCDEIALIRDTASGRRERDPGEAERSGKEADA